MMVLQQAVKIAGSTKPDAIKAAVSKIKGFQGLGGTFDFTKGDGEGLHGFSSFILTDGKFELFDSWVTAGGYDKLKAAS
jgi:branched-chain amino acid transport system substrate-binding protein